MSAAASAQILMSASHDDKPGLSTMAFISDSTTLSRVSADLFSMTLGKANIREGSIDAALAIGDWPRDLDLLIVDLADAADPIADAAALKTAVPGGCLVIGVGRINDVALFRDLIAVGFNDYLALPFAEGAMSRAVDRALELRQRAGSAVMPGQTPLKDAAPRTLSVIGARGGVGATTTAVAIAAMLGIRLKEDVLLIDFDLHYGSLMLALDLGAIDEHLLLGRLIVGDALERDMRHDPADVFTLLVLLADVNEAAGWPTGFFFELVIREGRREHALAGKSQWHSAGVDRDPSPAPLFGDVRGRAAASGWVEHEVAGVGGHENTAGDHLG
jgi:hypothetical protein